LYLTRFRYKYCQLAPFAAFTRVEVQVPGTEYKAQVCAMYFYCIVHVQVPLSLICPQRIRWNDPQFGIITADAGCGIVQVPATGS